MQEWQILPGSSGEEEGDTMTAKEYMKQYRESYEAVQEIAEHLADLKAEAVTLQGHDGQKASLDAAVARYVDACGEQASELARIDRLRSEILRTVHSIPDKRLRQLLREVYILGRPLVRIAADRGQSYEHICRRHGEALNAVRKVRPELK